MNMIEKVASALFEAFKNNNSQYIMDKLKFLAIKFHQLDDDNHYRRMFLAQARIAIEAMREPSDDMIMSGTNCLDYPNDDYHTVKDLFQSMIDEALKGE